MDDEDPTVPAHLRPALGAAAELELELSTDGHWPDEDEPRAAHREEIMRASRVVDLWAADCCTREQVGKLAHRAAAEQQPGRWPRTLGEADDVVRRAALTRDLIMLRDTLGARPTQEELDEFD
jgi:hypothetical protein